MNMAQASALERAHQAATLINREMELVAAPLLAIEAFIRMDPSFLTLAATVEPWSKHFYVKVTITGQELVCP